MLSWYMVHLTLTRKHWNYVFENPNRCGGGDIKSLAINDDGTALIVYEEIGGKWSLVFIMIYEEIGGKCKGP